MDIRVAGNINMVDELSESGHVETASG